MIHTLFSLILQETSCLRQKSIFHPYFLLGVSQGLLVLVKLRRLSKTTPGMFVSGISDRDQCVLCPVYVWEHSYRSRTMPAN